jgi:exopolysaccharide production protein ExoQ
VRTAIGSRELGPDSARQLDPRRRTFGLAQLDGFFAGIALASVGAIYIFGTPFALLFCLCSGLVFALRPVWSIKDLTKFSWLLVLPLLAALSTLWSDAPERTLRTGLQLILTVGATVIVCRRITARQAILVLWVSFLAMCLIALPDIATSAVSGKPLIGPFGSKNQMASTAHVLFALSLALGLDNQQPLICRLSTPLSILLAIVCVRLSQSAGATISIFITLATLPPIIIFPKANLTIRWLTGFFLLSMLVIALVFSADLKMALTDFQVHELKKDTTLTGRTYLWDFAARFSEQRPWLGHGYSAFWRQGNIDAEGLWRWGGIANRSGFNFHNAFVETRVDLGLVGVVLFAATCIGVAWTTMVRQLTSPSIPGAFFASMLLVLYARSYGESGLLYPFNFMTVMWMAAAVFSFERVSSKALPPTATTVRTPNHGVTYTNRV